MVSLIVQDRFYEIFRLPLGILCISNNYSSLEYFQQQDERNSKHAMEIYKSIFWILILQTYILYVSSEIKERIYIYYKQQTKITNLPQMNTMTKKSGIWPFRFILLWSFIIINLNCQSMHIGLVADQKPSQNPLSNLSSKSDAELSDLREHYLIGCKKIFHQHGYMNVKGDAPYDFTCDSSHRCPKCEEAFSSVRYHISKRADQKIQIQNAKKALQKMQQTREKYFMGQPGCQCKKDKMCKPCFDKLQADVTKYQKGCGASWQQQFGGMAAGPATVTCQDNYFLCDSCSNELYYLNKVSAQYPHVKLVHIPKIERMF